MPKQENTDAQASEENPTHWDDKAKDFFSKNPALVLTMLYLYVVAVGFLHSVALYGAFGINIIEYSEVTDLLLAAFKKPSILVLVGVHAVFFLIVLALAKRTSKALQSASHATRTGLRTFLWLPGAFAVLIAILSTYFIGSVAASGIKAGLIHEEEVRYRAFKGSAGQVTEPDLRLIGATQKAVFYYDKKDNRTVVIPYTQLISIEVPEEVPDNE